MEDAKVDGKFYTMEDGCAPMNAPLSMGNITGNIMTCPFHGEKFDVTSGKKMAEPVLTPSQEKELLLKMWAKIHGSHRSANLRHKDI
jgi:nitrite reductase/ring-hydroxylating ferredoxin subunit